MPTKRLNPLVLDSVGVFGLNTQANASSLDHRWLVKSDNIMINSEGRLTSRKGIQAISATVGNYPVKSVHSHTNTDGTTSLISSANSKIWKIDSTAVPKVNTEQTFTGTPQTITGDNWQWVQYDDDSIGVQAGHRPIHYTSGTGVWADLEDTATYAASTNITTFDPSTMLSQYGRLWAAGFTEDKETVLYSRTLQHHKWTGTGAGVLNMKSVWGYDEIVALESFNGKLIIFGKNNIAIYNDPFDPSATTFALDEVIQGVGCVARDSVQSTGSDLFFLSSRGVMSLGRVVQEKSLPLNDISKNVRSDLLQTLAQETHANGHREAIKSIYSPIDAFYLITFPDSSLVYCFDLRQALENGAYRATTWTAIKPISFSIFADDHLYMGHDEGIVEYDSYLDGTTKYQMRYFSNPLDFGNASNLKFLKKFNVTIIGGQNTESTLNWGYDYTSDYTKQALTFGTASAAEYGVTEYNTTGEYTASIVIQTPKVNTSGNGEIVTIGIEAEVNDSPFSIQKIDIHALLGRLI